MLRPAAAGSPSAEGPPGRPCATLPPASRRSHAIDLDPATSPLLTPLLAVLVVLVIALTLAVVVQTRRVGRLARRVDGMTRGSDGGSLEAMLTGSLERVDRIGREVDQLAARSAVIEGGLRGAVQRVALIRFNPFEETGGNQSFALALMDAAGNGLVISSLHARAGTRIYGKALVGGRAETALSAEETEAVRVALASPRRGG